MDQIDFHQFGTGIDGNDSDPSPEMFIDLETIELRWRRWLAQRFPSSFPSSLTIYIKY